MKVKEESEKAGLKLNIQNTKIMASGPVTSWQTDGEKMETVTDFIFLGSRITVDGECSHEIKGCLFLQRKALTLCNPLDCSLAGYSLHGISRQEYWRGLPFPFPGDLPNPGIELRSPTL